METSNDIFGLDSFIEQVLIKRFPSEPYKHHVKRTSKGLRFHCPFCGDTYNPRATPRGNLYLKTKHYLCFNGGCFESMSLQKFVSKFSSEFNIDIDGMDLTALSSDEIRSDSAYNKLILTKDNDIYNYVDDMGLLNYLPNVADIINLFGLRNVYSLPADSEVRKFLNRRNAYQIPDLNKRVFSNVTDDKIFIMNVDDLSGKLLSYSSRDINKKSYIIQIYSDILKFWAPQIPEILQENIDFLDNISSYFNILNLDFSEPINVAEGQFDAMFLNNYMALQGVSKIDFVIKHMKLNHINAFMDRDGAGYKTTFRLLDGYGIFLWSSVIEKLKRAFSENINNINKIHDINELFSFLYKQSCGTFTHADFNKFIMKNVSDNIYDHLLM